jgi:hypothetical protein
MEVVSEMSAVSLPTLQVVGDSLAYHSFNTTKEREGGECVVHEFA